MIRRAVDSDVPAENASRFQQPLGMPLGHPTASTAPTMTGYSWCPLFPAGPDASWTLRGPLCPLCFKTRPPLENSFSATF